MASRFTGGGEVISMLHFVINERAGNGQGAKKWQRVKEQLSVPYKVHITQYEKHAIELVHTLCNEAKLGDEKTVIIVVGGDGSIHEALNGFDWGSSVMLGAVSAGSGNDFNRGYGSFKTAREIERFLQDGKSTTHDLGLIEAGNQTISFVNNCGIGFDATVAITANESKTKKRFNKLGLGKLSYAFYLVKCLFTFKPFDLIVTTEGGERTFENVWFVTASNQPFFGGGMKISPSSKTNDGQLELTVVHNLSRLKLLFVFSTVFFGKHTGFKEIEQLTASSFKLTMHETYLFHADGEKLLIDTASAPIICKVQPNYWQLAK